VAYLPHKETSHLQKFLCSGFQKFHPLTFLLFFLFSFLGLQPSPYCAQVSTVALTSAGVEVLIPKLYPIVLVDENIDHPLGLGGMQQGQIFTGC
jgi:hypothetical protein